MTTVLEVVKHAGVPKATVSRVLSGNSYVSQEIKDYVFRAVEESGYHPNSLACNLSAKSTQTLGLAVTNTLYHGAYFSELLFHTVRMAEEKGQQLLLADGKHSAEGGRQAIQYLLDPHCNVIIIYPCFLSVDKINDIIDAHSQLIMVLNHHLRKNNSHSVWCGHKQTSFNAVVELINVGHQEIAFLTDSTDSPTDIERLAGYKDALAQHGIALNEKFIADGRWTPASGAEGVETSLERGTKFSVLVVSNDDMAISAMKALRECGIAMSERVSVIGFDDIAIASYTVPTLSDVEIPVTETIQEIIERLIFMFSDGDFSPSRTFSRRLIRRDLLTAPPR